MNGPCPQHGSDQQLKHTHVPIVVAPRLIAVLTDSLQLRAALVLCIKQTSILSGHGG